MIKNEARFDSLIQSALAQDFSGWDFSYLKDRWHEYPVPWDYKALVTHNMQGVNSMLDMGTGGGEFLSSLQPLPEDTQASEAWTPNISVAKARLEPLGVTVHGIEEYAGLPLDDNHFDLVINRHEWYDPVEVHRILKPGGIFLTQQVGDKNDIRLNDLLDSPPANDDTWDLNFASRQLAEANFEILRREEAFPPLHFFDIGAIVYYLKVIEWQIPDFSVEKYREKLGVLHNMIETDGKLVVNQHRFLLIARKPE